MPRSRNDPSGLLTVIGEAHDLDELEPFTPEVLERVAEALGCDFASYYELALTTGEVSVYLQDAYQAAVAPLVIPSPIADVDRARHVRLGNLSGDGVGAWSDVYPRVVRRQMGARESGAFGIGEAAWLAFGDHRSRSCWLALHQRRDVTDAQRDRLLRSRTHVASLIRHADTRRRLADAMLAVDADDEEGATGVFLLGPSLGVERISPAARRIVARWFERFEDDLPNELADWLRSPFPREPLRVERGRDRLVVETPTRGALTLREERVASDSLTAREHEVMRRVGDGMSNDEIAQALWVTPSTVRKHLQHIYDKLGVTSRTAALAALRRTRT